MKRKRVIKFNIRMNKYDIRSHITSQTWLMDKICSNVLFPEVFFPVSLRELVFWGWWNVYLLTLLCYFVVILHLFSQSFGIVFLCGSRLLNVTFSFLSARCIRWPGFFPIRVSCRCGSDVVWLGLLCCTRFIRTLITGCSASFHLLLREFHILELRPLLIHWSLKYQSVERPNLLGLTSRLTFEYGMTFPSLCLTPVRWMGSMVQSTVGCFSELCFLQFSVVQVLVGCDSNL